MSVTPLGGFIASSFRTFSIMGVGGEASGRSTVLPSNRKRIRAIIISDQDLVVSSDGTQGGNGTFELKKGVKFDYRCTEGIKAFAVSGTANLEVTEYYYE